MPNSTEIKAPAQTQDGFVWCVGNQALLDADNDASRQLLHAMLTEENAVSEHFLSTLADSSGSIAKKLRSRDGSDDESLAVRMGRHLYFERWSKGDDHLVYCRRGWDEATADDTPNARHPATEDMLDVNALAQNRAFFELGDVGVSPCETLLAWTADTLGDERYRLFVKHLSTGDVLEISPEFVDAEFEWADTTPPSLVYGRVDDDDRVSAVFLHRLGSAWESDVAIFTEADEAWSCGAYKSRCGRIIFIQTDSFSGNELHTLDARNPEHAPVLILAREEGCECYPELMGDELLILTCDEDNPEFRMFRAGLGHRARSDWRLVMSPDDGAQLELVEAWADFYLVSIRRGAAVHIEFYDADDKLLRTVRPTHALGEVSVHENPASTSPSCRLVRTSPVDPEQIFSIDPVTGIEKLLWEENPGDDYKPSDYAATRCFAPAHDGQLVPVSLVWKRDQKRAGGNPVLLHAYGAYDDVADLTLDTDRLALLDEGIVWAVAHVRGGGERGRGWYEGGRLQSKFNSIGDYLACIEYLEQSAVLSPGECIAEGRSAGGVVVAAAVQARPEKFCSLLAEVPFVDMVNSLRDESLPTTAADREEFGDPDEPDELATIFRISPADNVPRRAFPPMLITAGLHDTRVPVREALRWIDRLRERKTTDSTIILVADTLAGHQGPSGRAAEIRRLAEFQAFALWSLKARIQSKN